MQLPHNYARIMDPEVADSTPMWPRPKRTLFAEKGDHNNSLPFMKGVGGLGAAHLYNFIRKP